MEPDLSPAQLRAAREALRQFAVRTEPLVEIEVRAIEGGGVALVSEGTDFVHAVMTDEAWAYFCRET